jgi:Ca-activated chloride channel family protein
VTVTDAGGKRVGSLTQADFAVLEDGRPQDLVFFSPGEAALSVALLIDTSSSMEEYMPVVQKAAIGFIAQLRPGDLAQVIDFDSRVQVAQPLTSDRKLLIDAVQRMRAGGSTALYNAIYIALREFEKARASNPDEIRRQVIIVLSDGEDTSSLVTFEEVLEQTKRSPTAIYAVSLGSGGAQSALTQETGEFILRQLAQASGGRLYVAQRAEHVTNVYAEIAEDVTNQYSLGYISNNPRKDGGWRTINVRVQRPNLVARTRSGYYGPTLAP